MDLLQQFIEIGIVGAFLSIIIQIIKQKFATQPNTSKLLAIGLSCVAGAGYYFLVGTPIWASIIGVLSAASTFYALFIKEDKPV